MQPSIPNSLSPSVKVHVYHSHGALRRGEGIQGLYCGLHSNYLVHGCANDDTEGKRFKSPFHCCDVSNPPYLLSGELCTTPLQCKLLFVYTVCCRHNGQCFSVLRTRKPDVIVTQWTAIVGEVTSPCSDTMCHSCSPVPQTFQIHGTLLVNNYHYLTISNFVLSVNCENFITFVHSRKVWVKAAVCNQCF